ncbi:MOSC domain-containing protein [Parahaliea mediterranea]|uniref:MOSC domain-containing protein n=1 Tax=Parahaliea mediterranea TaxID=651086 RepID=A0A939DEL2_9GAMM|nr:MOSC domain-containing protein [Parahaliea mediterranea]MBN7796644.1 MOSC domain-containing protein [Parahaliea mediterranea]
MSVQRQLFARYARDLPSGTLTWIGLRPARRADMVAVDAVRALASLGLEGDHRCAKTPGSGRQVTLISEEFIAQIAHFSGRPSVLPAMLRRNLVVRGINLNALRHQRFRIGEAEFAATALCHPCRRMEVALGEGGVAAMLGHGGLCARVEQSGAIRVGDAIEVIIDES